MTVVFRNLFSNAIKFSKRGGKVLVSVTRKANRTGLELVLISVKDSGAGLSAQNLTKLFQGANESFFHPWYPVRPFNFRTRRDVPCFRGHAV